ncbi:MAG TPA: hypothetical protein VK178_06720 [Opitutaceae bacterium]|nr:hypothetical protein [Opitutaceae bacterium]
MPLAPAFLSATDQTVAVRTTREALPAAWRGIALLGAGHFVIELASSYALNRTLDATELGAGAVLAYNAVAFWGQVPLGLAADRWRGARTLAVGGALLAIAGLALCGVAAWPVVLLIALGNGCYHVGGGALTIERSAGRLGGLGLFVGPGALGLTLGVGLARMDFTATPWVLGAAAVGLALAIGRLDGAASAGGAWLQPNSLGGRRSADRLQAGSYLRSVVVVALVLACIAIRAFVGGGFGFAWGGSAAAALAVASALAGGKIAGGFLADRFGWLRTTLVVLAFSVPALWFGRTAMPAGLAGVAFFQMPMAVTLGALVRTLPGRPGLAFGLASAAVYLGGFPLLAGDVRLLHSFGGLCGLSLAAVVMLAAGMRGKAEKIG